MAITVGGETLAPRVQVVSSAYSLSTDHFDGLDSTAFAASSHDHSGAAITSGTVVEARIDSTIARDSEIFPTLLANDGPSSELNADDLDAYDSTDFAFAGHSHANLAPGSGLSGGTYNGSTAVSFDLGPLDAD